MRIQVCTQNGESIIPKENQRNFEFAILGGKETGKNRVILIFS